MLGPIQSNYLFEQGQSSEDGKEQQPATKYTGTIQSNYLFEQGQSSEDGKESKHGKNKNKITPKFLSLLSLSFSFSFSLSQNKHFTIIT